MHVCCLQFFLQHHTLRWPHSVVHVMNFYCDYCPNPALTPVISGRIGTDRERHGVCRLCLSLESSRAQHTLITCLSLHLIAVQMSNIHQRRWLSLRIFLSETFLESSNFLCIHFHSFTAYTSKCFTRSKCLPRFMSLIFSLGDGVFSDSLIRFALLFLIQSYSGLGSN